MIYITEEAANHLHIVVSGRVRIGRYLSDGSDSTKTILSAGEVFGEMALAGETSRTEYAESMDKDTQICTLEIKEVQKLMRTDADMSLRILKWMGLRLIRLERKLELLTFKDARTRIVEFLKDAAAYKGTLVGDETMIRTRLTHGDIATLTATSRQTVSEVLNQLRTEDQIFFERGKILVRNVAGLK